MDRTLDKSAARASGEVPARSVAAAGTVASFAALFAAAACCVLPLALAILGLGAGGLAVFVPLRWPLTIASIVVVSAGWLVYLRKRRACAGDASCRIAPPSRFTFVLLSVATIFVVLSSAWGSIEAPLMRALGGV
jgi:mercuric ion transport protein